MSLEDKDLNNLPQETPAEPTEPEAKMIGLDEEELFENSTVFSAPTAKEKKKKGGNKKLRNIIAAVVLVVILAGAVFAIVKFIPTTEEAQAGNSSVTESTLDIPIATIAEDDITAVTVENAVGGYKVTPVYSTATDSNGDVGRQITWYLDGIDQSLTDSTLVGGVISDLTTLKAVRLMEEDAADLSVYGLDDPVITVTVESEDAEGYTLYLGDDSPAGDGKYAYLDGSKDVYLIDATVVSTFQSAKTAYVSAQMITSLAKTDENADYFDADGLLASFDYMIIGGSAHADAIRIEPNTYGATSYIPYLMTEPVKQNVLGATGDAVLSPIKSGLMADAVYAVDPDDAVIKQYGLDAPLVTVEYKIGDFSTRIWLNNAPDDGYYAVMVEGKPVIYKLLKTELSFAEYAPEQFFNNYIFLDDITTVEQITVTTATGTRTYALTHGVDENEEVTLSVTGDGKELNAEDFRSVYQYMITCYASEFTLEPAPEGAADLTIEVDYVDDARANLTVAYKKATDRRYHVTVDGVPLGYAFLNTVDNLIEYETKYYNGEEVPAP